MTLVPRKNLKKLAIRIRSAVGRVGSQANAAAACGVSLRQMQNYATARAEPPPETLARLAASTGTSLEWLMSGEGEEISGLPLPPGVRPDAPHVLAVLASSSTALSRTRDLNNTSTSVTIRDASIATGDIWATLKSEGRSVSPTRFVSLLVNTQQQLLEIIDNSGLRFRSRSNKEALISDVLCWMIRELDGIDDEPKWNRAVAFAAQAVGRSISLARGIVDIFEKRANSIAFGEFVCDECDINKNKRLAILFGANEVVFRHLKRISEHSLFPNGDDVPTD